MLTRVRVLGVMLMIAAVPCWAQQKNPTGQAATTGACSPAVTGDNNQFKIDCRGLTKEQGAKMLQILNKILANQLDPEAVMAKLDEILRAVNPNVPTKVYLCNGQVRTAGPGKNAAFEITLSGDDSAFQEMAHLNNTGQYPELLTRCLSEMQSKPEWLTPRLFCGLAYLAMKNTTKAKEMLAGFDSKTGPAYETEDCQQISTYLHKYLQ